MPRGAGRVVQKAAQGFAEIMVRMGSVRFGFVRQSRKHKAEIESRTPIGTGDRGGNGDGAGLFRKPHNTKYANDVGKQEQANK